MRFWRKKQTWKVIAALLFAVWILMGDRKINVKAESMETENFTGETAVCPYKHQYVSLVWEQC